MFKKGQLVKTKRSGHYAIVKRVSNEVPGIYYIAHPYWHFDLLVREDGIALIGNNFKFKGGK